MTRPALDPVDWIERLVDPGSFLPSFPSSGTADGFAFGPEIVAGLARVADRPIALYAQSVDVGQGFVSARGATKIHRLMEKAGELGVPVVALLASPGVDVQDGLKSGEAYTRVIAANIALSGVVPQLGAVMSVTMGAPAYSCTLMDLVLFNKSRSHLAVTGPSVVREMLGAETTLADLGGSEVHARQTGIAHFVDKNAAEQIERLKWLVAFFPSNRAEPPPRALPALPTAPLPELPARAEQVFDVTKLVDALVDGSQWVEYGKDFGGAIVCAFARIDGHPVGLVANQSAVESGAIGARAAAKAARFIRLCDAYNVPVLTLIDVPGFMPGQKEEQAGLLRHGAQLCAAMQTGVPRISVVVRRCYGAAAFVMMQARSQGGDLVLALEGASIAVMGFRAAKSMVYGAEVEVGAEELRARYRRDYEAPVNAYREGLIDEIVPVERVRDRLALHLAWLARKQVRPPSTRRHAVLP